MNKVISLLLLFCFLMLVGCELNTTDDTTRNKNRGFETESLGKIFYENCATAGCHSSDNPVNGLSLASHTELFRGSFDRPVDGSNNYGGDVVIPYNVSKSLLYQFITGNIDTELAVSHLMLTGAEVLEIKEWIEEGAKDYQLNVPFSTPNPFRVYACNRGSDAISVIDGGQNVVSRIADVGFTDNFPDLPVHVEELGEFYYVTLAAKGSFLKIRKSDNEIVGELTGLGFPGDFILMTRSNKAYIARSLLSNQTYNTIYSVNYESMTLITEVVLPYTGLPVGVELSLNEQVLYVSNSIVDAISLINTATDDTGNFFPIVLPNDFNPTYIKLDPFGLLLYVSAPGTNQMVPIDLPSGLPMAPVNISANPSQIAVKSDGSKIYITSLGDNVVDVIDRILVQFTWTRRISHPAFSMLDGITITKNDALLYVTGRNSEGEFEVPYPVKSERTPGVVGIIDVASERVIKVIEVEERPSGIATE